MEKGGDVIVRHHLAFSGLQINREQDEINFISKKPILEASIKWNERCVIFLGIRRALLKIKRKNGEALLVAAALQFFRVRNREQLDDLKSIFRPEAVIRDQGVGNLKFRLWN